MARYDVYRLADTDILMLDVQSDLLDDLPTRAVIPLYRDRSGGRLIKRLHASITIGSANYVLATHQIASVPAAELQNPIANLTSAHDDISRAIFMLFEGF
ncbi:hypothetical protein C9R18_26245 [Salmonella enterica subsp. enterica serovar Enteritidis]|nr:hypothetical protein [Salmonella enterica subsp. enterica]EBU8132068.1 hypothetical protein [Salmonella enterica subsp. enterica serovar Java]EBW2250144.1 hypothetical protein [Salmonella enterica subsp. enterica serovar Enteritidis]EBX4816998.1 hypothetical protein [Salmonella enterica subsp. enterica serovar Newport]EFG2587013.1 hypothetical protein [Escherichia coli]